eukprot:9265974-Pyramimonas_sp.AAC.1
MRRGTIGPALPTARGGTEPVKHILLHEAVQRGVHAVFAGQHGLLGAEGGGVAPISGGPHVPRRALRVQRGGCVRPHLPEAASRTVRGQYEPSQ